MSDLGVDPATGDLALVTGAAQLVTGAAAVAQAWETHLTMFLGEWFRDLSLGIDYQNLILVKSPSYPVIRAVLARASRETPGVRTVDDIQFAFDARARVLTVRAQVTTTDGDRLTLALAEPIGGAA